MKEISCKFEFHHVSFYNTVNGAKDYRNGTHKRLEYQYNKKTKEWSVYDIKTEKSRPSSKEEMLKDKAICDHYQKNLGTGYIRV